MPGLTQRYALPRLVRRGIDETLTLDVYNSAGTQQTATTGTLSVFAGSRAIVDGATVSTFGPPASYLLTAATTVDEQLSDRWLEVWTMTIGGATEVFQRPAFLVRRTFDPVIDDRDLIALHSDLADLRDPDQTTYQGQRDEAWIELNKMLIQKGNRPQLIFDGWGLRALHQYLTLEILFRDFATSVGDGRYAKLEERYRQLAHEEFNSLQFYYDWDEDGFIDGQLEHKAAQPVTMLQTPWGWWL